jgi:hypothetical protein
MARLMATTLLATLTSSCGLVGPTCVSRQQRGSVTTITGRVEPGQVLSHQVRYDTRGSQNDARVEWSDARLPDGPRLRFFATRVGCSDFEPPAASNAGDCAVLSRAGAGDLGIADTLSVTHGRGNPEQLGNPPEYKIWIVGDPQRGALYTITITWFFGPDC